MNMPPSKQHQKKSRRKWSRSRGEGSGSSGHHSDSQSRSRRHERTQQQHQQQQQQQQGREDRQKRHQEKLALSQRLRGLSSQKRLRECVALYRSPANDELRDAHHASVVVDCCARCGDVDEAEAVVGGLLRPSSGTTRGDDGPEEGYFWERRRPEASKGVPIQAWTALLKGYVHSGMMAKADALFRHLCSAESPAPEADDGSHKKRKRAKDGRENGANVRTLNTLLRGCLWTATSLDGAANKGSLESKDTPRNDLVGGLLTAERAWSLASGRIPFDCSSYEYFISLLSQSLQCERAEECLRQMRRELEIPDVESNADDVDPTTFESLAACLVSIARGYALLGKAGDGRRCAEEAIRSVDASERANSANRSTEGAPSAEEQKHAKGGKRSWANANSTGEGGSNERREESNRLFRSHRLSELRSEAQNCLQTSMPSTAQTNQAAFVARTMLTRLLYFSGGGTTGKDATKATPSTEAKREDETESRWIHSLWHSFGLKEAVQCMADETDDFNELAHILQSTSPKKHSKQQRKSKTLPLVLSARICKQLRGHIAGEDSVMMSNGTIDFEQVFRPLHDDAKEDRNLHIELGAGSGDWAILQAQLNPSDDYVTVELRADRVAQTFAKGLLHHPGGDERKMGLPNLCCVGSECGSFLRERVVPRTVRTIFVNHPEPPTQTFATTSNEASAGGPAVMGDDEPAHMLHSQTVLSAARCLEPNGKGRLIIVTDNLIYARLICQTVAQLLENDLTLLGLPLSELKDLKRIGSFGHSSLHLYEGKPSSSIGHYVKVDGGTSYFDRLWRTGAGKHADVKRRYIIALKTSGGEIRPDQKAKSFQRREMAAGGKGGHSKKPPHKKRRSDEKQRRRNERRLLKKQLAQGGKSK
ncbi:hypothetical protein ACHAWF_007767 [Thalassiosira exigua]